MLQCIALQVQGPALVGALTLISLQVWTNTCRAHWHSLQVVLLIASSCNQTDLKWLLCELETGWTLFCFIQGLDIKSDYMSFGLKLCVSSTVVWNSLNQSFTLDFQLYVHWPALNPQRANKGMKKKNPGQMKGATWASTALLIRPHFIYLSKGDDEKCPRNEQRLHQGLYLSKWTLQDRKMERNSMPWQWQAIKWCNKIAYFLPAERTFIRCGARILGKKKIFIYKASYPESLQKDFAMKQIWHSWMRKIQQNPVWHANWNHCLHRAGCWVTGCFCKLSIVCSFCTLCNHRLVMTAGRWSNSQKTPEIHNTAFLWNKPTLTRSYCLLFCFVFIISSVTQKITLCSSQTEGISSNIQELRGGKKFITA